MITALGPSTLDLSTIHLARLDPGADADDAGDDAERVGGVQIDVDISPLSTPPAATPTPGIPPLTGTTPSGIDLPLVLILVAVAHIIAALARRVRR